MPLYSYQCRKRHESIRVHSFSDCPPIGTVTTCDTCGQNSKRVLCALSQYGQTKFGGQFRNQELALGRKFNSVKEIDEHCKKEGLVHIGNSRREIGQIRKARLERE